jgi:cytochrome c biogenesis protein CcmG/thiol:disulfide interchange protein DsbE
MRRHLGRLLILFGVAGWLIAIGFMYIHSWKERSTNNVSPSVGHVAPDFELTNLSSQSIRLGDLRGRPVLINFWTTWCSYCLQELPVIEKYYEYYATELIVLAVNVGDSLADVRSLVAKYGFTFPILRDPDSNVFQRYRLDSFPVTFVLDTEGIVLVKHQGYMSESKLVEYLNKVGLSR